MLYQIIKLEERSPLFYHKKPLIKRTLDSHYARTPTRIPRGFYECEWTNYGRRHPSQSQLGKASQDWTQMGDQERINEQIAVRR